MNAYNAGNLEAFLATYADKAELYIFPGELLVKGKEEMTRIYEELFKKYPELRCKVKTQIGQRNAIFLKESMSGMASKTLNVISIYEVIQNKISKVHIINE